MSTDLLPTTAALLQLAVERADDQTCMAIIGLRRHVVIQRAIRLARDPEVSTAFPAATAAILGRVERQREARSWR